MVLLFLLLLSFVLIFYFFFFKQKTAYEMRISDWSSDVCSSDLTHLEAHVERDVLGQMAQDVLGVDDLHRMVDHDVAGGHHALALLGQGQGHFIARIDRKSVV